jgi:sodium-dependent phosphate cotransporter
VIILIASLLVLCGCLVVMVKILGSLFKGSIAKVLQKVVNSDLPGVFGYVSFDMNFHYLKIKKKTIF